MPFDDNERVLVQRFNHKKVYVEIYRGNRGGTCRACKLEHEPEKVKCDNCGKPIKAQPIFFIHILGTEVMDQPTEKEAMDWARAFIDDRIDRLQADLYDSVMDPDDEQEEPDAKEEDGEPSNEAAEGKQDLSPLEKQVVKLGWVRKANAILANIQAQA